MSVMILLLDSHTFKMIIPSWQFLMALPSFYVVDVKIFWGGHDLRPPKIRGLAALNMSQPPTLPAADTYIETF